MKKIIVPFVLLAMLIACNTNKNNLTSTPTPQPVQTTDKPQKSEMKESDMKITPITYEKKTLPTKSKMKPMEAVIIADSVVPKN